MGWGEGGLRRDRVSGMGREGACSLWLGGCDTWFGCWVHYRGNGDFAVFTVFAIFLEATSTVHSLIRNSYIQKKRSDIYQLSVYCVPCENLLSLKETELIFLIKA